MVEEALTPFISFGVAIIGGIIVGYAIKKVIKIALIIIGLIIFGVVVLQGMDWVDTKYNKIQTDAIQFINNTNIYPQLTSFTDNFNIFILLGLLIGGIIGFAKAG